MQLKKEAEQEAKIYNLMILMRNWVKFHNELDEFKPDWNNGTQNKYVIELAQNSIKTAIRLNYNTGLFNIAVSSRQRANELLAEFKTEIEEVIPYL